MGLPLSFHGGVSLETSLIPFLQMKKLIYVPVQVYQAKPITQIPEPEMFPSTMTVAPVEVEKPKPEQCKF